MAVIGSNSYLFPCYWESNGEGQELTRLQWYLLWERVLLKTNHWIEKYGLSDIVNHIPAWFWIREKLSGLNVYISLNRNAMKTWWYLMSHDRQQKWGPAEIWTRIAGFRVQSANRYTTEPAMWALHPNIGSIFAQKGSNWSNLSGVGRNGVVKVSSARNSSTFAFLIQKSFTPDMGLEPMTLRCLWEIFSCKSLMLYRLS